MSNIEFIALVLGLATGVLAVILFLRSENRNTRIIVGTSVIIIVIAMFIVAPLLPQQNFIPGQQSSRDQNSSGQTSSGQTSGRDQTSGGQNSSGQTSGSTDTGGPPPKLQVTPTNLSESNCDYFQGKGWLCNVSLQNLDGSRRLNWYANGTKGITIFQSTGWLTPNESWTVLVTIPPAECPANDNIKFSVQGGDTTNVSWSCTNPPTPFPSG